MPESGNEGFSPNSSKNSEDAILTKSFDVRNATIPGDTFYPNLLQPQVEYANQSLIKGLYGELPKPLVELDNQEAVTASLEAFCESVNDSALQEYIDTFKRPQATLPAGKFFLEAHHGIDTKNEKKKGSFFVDSDYSLLLGFTPQEKEPQVISAISFGYGPKVDTLVSHNSENSPVIVQIQGPTLSEDPDFDTYDSKDKYERAREVLSTFHWEHALVLTVASWAKNMKLPGVYILPASKHFYQKDVSPNPAVREQFMERMKIRHEVTAKRCGFKKEADGFYGLHFYYPESVK